MIPLRISVIPVIAALAATALVAGSCSSTARPAAPATTATAESTDPLGPRPLAVATPDFVPEEPVSFHGPHGTTVLLMERHTLPLIALSVVVPYGAAAEPTDRPGLAHVAAEMMDQGAGSLDAAAYAQALDDLGVQFSSGADRDTSTVSLECLATRLPDALPLLVAALAQPRHGAADFERVSALWMDGLRRRHDEPQSVCRLVATAAAYGRATPYGHPLEGSLATAAAITLDQVDGWHRAIWRPDAATIVVVGDITRARLEELLDRATTEWSAPAEAAPPVIAPDHASPPRLRTIVVDRPGAPQVVVCLARGGVAASDPALPGLELVNVALGGSFTSRLNQDLREDHGWTYGIGSRMSARRGPGMFVAQAAIRSDAISPALREMRAVIADVAAHGITAAELVKSRSQAQADLVESYGTVAQLANHIAGGAGLGLGLAHDREALATQRAATVDDLAALARTHLSIDAAVLVLVGPKEPILQAIAENALPAPEFSDADATDIDDADPHAAP